MLCSKGANTMRNVKAPAHVIYTAFIITILLLGMPGCAQTVTQTPLPTPTQTPTVRILSAPKTLCKAATQLWLAIVTENVSISDQETPWLLKATNDAVPLARGDWTIGAQELFIGFPEGQPLSPGEYSIDLYLRNDIVAQHTFAISPEVPEVVDVYLSLTPNGAPLPELLPVGIMHFYINFDFKGACTGAPYWITIRDTSTVQCHHTGNLTQSSGSGSVACYKEDSTAFQSGAYNATLVLMGEVESALSFQVRPATPNPTPTAAPPTPTPLFCEQLFTSAGLTPTGEPFLSRESFNWYTQAVYVGTRCKNLATDTIWQTLWHRNGEQIRTAQGQWSGESEGTIWDSITGLEEAPFLNPGTYTVTLELHDTTPLTTEFRIIAYPPNEE